MECVISEMVNEEDTIMFLDWSSFGYLMTDGKVFAPSSLDISYSYQVDQPEILYDYFRMKRQIPTKIVYIDYEGEKRLSIEDLNWKFNVFVNTYYQETDVREWEGYRVLLFERK